MRMGLMGAASALLFMAGTAQAAIVNGSFEDAVPFNNWVVQDTPNPFFALTNALGGTVDTFGWGWANTPTAGNFDVVTGWDGDPGVVRVAQDVFIDDATLTFDYRAAWDLTFGANVDRTFVVNIEVNGGGGNLGTQTFLTAVAGTTNFDTGPQSGAFDMSPWVGQTVRISFDWNVPETFTGPAQATLDNVQLIPAPGALALLGLAGLAARRRRRS